MSPFGIISDATEPGPEPDAPVTHGSDASDHDIHAPLKVGEADDHFGVEQTDQLQKIRRIEADDRLSSSKRINYKRSGELRPTTACRRANGSITKDPAN